MTPLAALVKMHCKSKKNDIIKNMLLIAGLGNPGEKYKKTRHNAGFQAIDKFAKENNFSGFRFSPKFKAEISKGTINNKEIVLAKPQTFMNDSGKPVKSLLCNRKKTRKDELLPVLIIHDDIDLPLGRIRIAKNRGAGGHKGVESIIKELKTKNFIRLRIGIGPKNNRRKTANKINTEEFVLKNFTKEEKEIIKKIIEKTVKAVEFFLKNGLEKTMSLYNK